MNTQQGSITCSCGEKNAAIAFRCQGCGKVFDGSAGHTIPHSRHLTIPGAAPGANGPLSARAQTTPASVHFPAPVRVSQRFPEAVHAKPKVKVAIVTFSETAELKQAPVSPDAVGAFHLNPKTSTNEAAGLKLAGEVWRQQVPNSRLNIILLGDGEPTAGGGWFGDAAEAALKAAGELKAEGARIATIGCYGPTMDLNHLRAIASSPALAFEARAGNVTPVFLQASQSITMNQWGREGAEFVVFVIDESGSMDEANKKGEVDEAVKASIEFLKRM